MFLLQPGEVLLELPPLLLVHSIPLTFMYRRNMKPYP
jgi:hypothetical protein